MNPTASSLTRAMLCPPSVVLPHAHDDVSSDIADRGRALHSAAEGDMAAVPKEHKAEASDLDLALPEGVRHEVAFAYDVATGVGRELDVKGRQYDRAQLTPTEIAGTADLWSPGYVGDLKSGFRDVAGPRENPQILVAAAANASLFGLDSATGEVIDIRDPANPKRRSDDVDTFDLEMFRGRLERMLLDIEATRQMHSRGMTLDVTEGDHCRYCPAMMSCPAKAKALARVEDGSTELEVNTAWAGGLTARSAPEAYRQYQALLMITKRMSSILYAYGKEHDIDLDDGKVFGLVTSQGNEKLDGNIAWPVIKDALGIEIAEQACGFTTSKKRIRDALRTVAGKGELAAKEKLVHEAIREAGGSSRKESTTVKEYRRKAS